VNSASHVNELIYSTDAPPTDVKLPTAKGVGCVFFRWLSDPSPVEAGVPAPVARIFAEALCAHFHLTFISALAGAAPKQWTAFDGHWAQTQTRLLRQKIPLIWTQNAALAVTAFDESWSTEGQMILLSTQPTPVEFDAFALQGDTAQIVNLLSNTHRVSPWVGALLPGVDGDFAGLYLSDKRLFTAMVNVELARICGCERENVQLRRRSAADFLQ
jgi:hypothetical protein